VALDDLVSFIKAKKEGAKPAKEVHAHEAHDGDEGLRAAYYRKIIERYAEVINLGEQKTIPELKALVNPEDAAIKEAGSRLSAAIEGYSFEAKFLEFAKSALELVRKLRPMHADIDISFWLSAKDVFELGVADSFDRTVILCSLLSYGGGNAVVRVVELEGGLKHPVVCFSHSGVWYVLDASSENEAMLSGPSLEDLLSSLAFEGRRFTRSLYEFNSAEYNSFE